MVVEAIHQRYPAAPVFAVGYSLGALLLTKYLADAESGQWDKKGLLHTIEGDLELWV